MTEAQKRAKQTYRRIHREQYNAYQKAYYHLNRDKMLAKSRLPDSVQKKRDYYRKKKEQKEQIPRAE